MKSLNNLLREIFTIDFFVFFLALFLNHMALIKAGVDPLSGMGWVFFFSLIIARYSGRLIPPESCKI